jgi:hypothetical protein
MGPDRIIIIRHCDKNEPKPGNLCSEQGYKRAALLAGFTVDKWEHSQNCYNNISGSCSKINFWTKYIRGSVDAIFAATSSFNKPGCQTSNRMCLIMEPTAYCLDKEINKPGGLIGLVGSDGSGGRVEFCVDEYPALVDYMRSNCKDTVLIAWEHEHIPLMIRDILSKSGYTGDLFPLWPKNDDRFDLVFIIDKPFTKNVTVKITTEKLGLPGDSLELPEVYQKYCLKEHLDTCVVAVVILLVLLILLVMFTS